MRIMFQATKGIEARLEYSIDRTTWASGKFIKGPLVIDLNLTQAAASYFRIVFNEIKKKKSNVRLKKKVAKKLLLSRRTHVRLKKKSN